jgi:anti-anti-sigma regulatory factor
MARKAKKPEYVPCAIAGRFDDKTASDLADKLAPKVKGKSVLGAILDFSDATHITAGGIVGLNRLGEQMRSDGKELIVRAMRSEMYKALKVGGVSDAVGFTHRSIS